MQSSCHFQIACARACPVHISIYSIGRWIFRVAKCNFAECECNFESNPFNVFKCFGASSATCVLTAFFWIVFWMKRERETEGERDKRNAELINRCRSFQLIYSLNKWTAHTADPYENCISIFVNRKSLQLATCSIWLVVTWFASPNSRPIYRENNLHFIIPFRSFALLLLLLLFSLHSNPVRVSRMQGMHAKCSFDSGLQYWFVDDKQAKWIGIIPSSHVAAKNKWCANRWRLARCAIHPWVHALRHTLPVCVFVQKNNLSRASVIRNRKKYNWIVLIKIAIDQTIVTPFDDAYWILIFSILFASLLCPISSHAILLPFVAFTRSRTANKNHSICTQFTQSRSKLLNGFTFVRFRFLYRREADRNGTNENQKFRLRAPTDKINKMPTQNHKFSV